MLGLLCLQGHFGSILHGIRSDTEYKEQILTPLKEPSRKVCARGFLSLMVMTAWLRAGEWPTCNSKGVTWDQALEHGGGGATSAQSLAALALLHDARYQYQPVAKERPGVLAGGAAARPPPPPGPLGQQQVSCSRAHLIIRLGGP